MDEDEYLDDTEFYDGEGFDEAGLPFAPLHLPAWLTGEPAAEEPAPAPEPAARLLTAEEFRAKYGLTG